MPWDRSPTRRARRSSERLADLGIVHDPIRVFDHSGGLDLARSRAASSATSCRSAFAAVTRRSTPEALDARAARAVRPPRRGLVAQPPGGASARRAGRGRPVLRPGDAEHARPRLSALELRRVDRHPELQSPGVGDAGRPRGGRLASFDPGRDRRARRKLGAVHDAGGRAGLLHVPAFPRDRPPRDTNRAGESYAATLVAPCSTTAGAPPGVVDDGLIRTAAQRASAAAALVLDRVDFGFPAPPRSTRRSAPGGLKKRTRPTTEVDEPGVESEGAIRSLTLPHDRQTLRFLTETTSSARELSAVGRPIVARSAVLAQDRVDDARCCGTGLRRGLAL